MTHVTDDVLAAIALGDPDVDAADLDHAESCPVCSVEVAELAQVHGLLREEVGVRGAHRVDPGPQVWPGVLAAMNEDAVRAPVTEPVVAEPVLNEVDQTAPTVAAPVEVTKPVTSDQPSSLAARRATRSTRPFGWLVAAAAACLLVGALVGRALWAPGETTQPVVASVPLTTLDASRQKEGTAELLGGQGQELRVDTQTTSPANGPQNGYVEVWLINTDGKRMVSLGVLSGTQATFPVPPDAIAQGYTIVDLSREQYDDRPQHSGDSIMRGTLPV
ncbi:MAG: anti-sigma factor [Lapillicoccus sp.]